MKLVVFDIDGTLCYSTSKPSVHVQSFEKALKTLYNVSEDIDIRKLKNDIGPGAPDLKISEYLISYAKKGGEITNDELRTFEEHVSKYYIDMFNNQCEAFNGVYRLIQDLSKNKNIVITLATGNFVNIGWEKIKAINCYDFFVNKIGGFGNHPNKTEALRYSIKEAEELFNTKFEKIVYFGDQITDYKAAVENNACFIGVEKNNKLFDDSCFTINDFEIEYENILNFIFN